MELSKIEKLVIKKETAKLQVEFDRAMGIVNDALAAYGKDFGINTEAEKGEWIISIFSMEYRSGFHRLAKAKLKVSQLPDTVLSALGTKAIKDTLEKIESISELKEELEYHEHD